MRMRKDGGAARKKTQLRTTRQFLIVITLYFTLNPSLNFTWADTQGLLMWLSVTLLVKFGLKIFISRVEVKRADLC